MKGLFDVNYVLIAMFALVIMITFNNFKLMKRAGQNKDYINCYKAMMNKDEDAYEKICNYIENATSEEYKNKARVFKLFYDLEKGTYEEELEKLDVHDFYYTNGKLDRKKIELNSESTIWLITLMAKANKLGLKDAVNSIYKKMESEENILGNYVEYNVLQSAKQIFNGEKEGNDFLRNLLNGDYAGYKYDKSLIGFTKKVAGCLLDYNHAPYADFDTDLKDFAGTKFGAMFMECLGIENKYKQEIKEVENQEVISLDENKENTEE